MLLMFALCFRITRIPADKLVSEMELFGSKYGLIIFEDIRVYLNKENGIRLNIDSYLKSYKIGIVGFVPSMPKYGRREMDFNYPVEIYNKVSSTVSDEI